MGATKICLIHGYTASKTSNWFPSFKKELQSEKIDVIIPDMPNSKNPQFEEWISHMEKVITHYDENTIFIGHSLGCVTLLNYLNTNRLNTVKGLILVSGFIEETPIPELQQFVQSELDFEYLINLTENRIAISAIDDDIIPYGYSKRMAEKLKAKFILLNKGKHFIDRDNFVNFPFLVKEVKKLIE
ncbi:RBBP9/YdeN family alpha/beta hydrolase [Zunongwangia pacifica]|uniref:Alpha/beta hydrolase n=1 Tax=Zunongwangia pacifica TaxID=2911062 RepID=A0A9X2CNP8_9FLAO|nr:alpha/beta fold hydrolase [Zunongwangia pacifica]MCL6218894.1 alpha/beta hydrolase [Zunongwangia pacifica]